MFCFVKWNKHSPILVIFFNLGTKSSLIWHEHDGNSLELYVFHLPARILEELEFVQIRKLCKPVNYIEILKKSIKIGWTTKDRQRGCVCAQKFIWRHHKIINRCILKSTAIIGIHSGPWKYNDVTWYGMHRILNRNTFRSMKIQCCDLVWNAQNIAWPSVTESVNTLVFERKKN